MNRTLISDDQNTYLKIVYCLTVRLIDLTLKLNRFSALKIENFCQLGHLLQCNNVTSPTTRGLACVKKYFIQLFNTKINKDCQQF